MTAEEFTEGRILLFDKPYGWTSFDVVARIRVLLRNYLGIKKIKVGHAGTLDPLATGLLVICTGRATKKIAGLQEGEKEYTGSFKLGATTPSFDLETAVDAEYETSHITEKLLQEVAASLTRAVMQLPPVFSAIKIDGKRSYEMARKGKAIDPEPRPVVISAFEICEVQMPEVFFKIVCSKGTYIRSIARDFGAACGSGAYLSSLRRTKSGCYDVTDAFTPESFERMLTDQAANNAKENQ